MSIRKIMWRMSYFFKRWQNNRSSCTEVFYQKGVFRNFAKFKGKHLSQSLFFNKAAILRSATLLKKRLWHRCFPMNFCKISRITFSYKTPPVAASGIISVRNSRLQMFIKIGKKRLRRKCFPMKFAQFLRTTFFTEHLRWLFLLCDLNLSHRNASHVTFLFFSFFYNDWPQQIYIEQLF